LAKRLTENQKNEMAQYFKNGKSIEALSKEFNCTILTITRNLKKNLGETIYKELVEKNKKFYEINTLSDKNKKKKNDFELTKKIPKNEFCDEYTFYNNQSNKNNFLNTEFVEISPLQVEIENVPRQEFSSIPIQEVDFPKTVYMVVQKNIELEIKLLKDYPEWQFLPNEDLQRKTIEIYYDIKLAKRACSKEQKVIKVPNTDVFKIVSPILISKGISRIISAEKLIAL
tara:strand:+ start:4356 stop:5039 length:684 start_codon:yes stop_codon:yes gene_type:complete